MKKEKKKGLKNPPPAPKCRGKQTTSIADADIKQDKGIEEERPPFFETDEIRCKCVADGCNEMRMIYSPTCKKHKGLLKTSNTMFDVDFDGNVKARFMDKPVIFMAKNGYGCPIELKDIKIKEVNQ